MQLVQSQSFTAQTGLTLSFRSLLKIAMTLRRTSQQNRQTRGCDLYASQSLPKSPLTHGSGCKWQWSACTWSSSAFSLKAWEESGSYTVFTHRPNIIWPGNEKETKQGRKQRWRRDLVLIQGKEGVAELWNFKPKLLSPLYKEVIWPFWMEE